MAAEGGKVLFVGTKRSARDAVQKEAARCSMPYVNQRWLGGMLTNFKTIRQSIKRLNELDEMAQSGALDRRGKKEAQMLRREMGQAAAQPGRHPRHDGAARCAVSSSTWGHEEIAIHEARKLGIPVVAVVDTNCSPDGIDYVIPATTMPCGPSWLYGRRRGRLGAGGQGFAAGSAGRARTNSWSWTKRATRRSAHPAPGAAGPPARGGQKKPPPRRKVPVTVVPGVAAVAASLDEVEVDDVDAADAPPARDASSQRPPAAQAGGPQQCAEAWGINAAGGAGAENRRRATSRVNFEEASPAAAMKL